MKFTDEQVAALRELAATTKINDLLNRLSNAAADSTDEQLCKLLTITMFVVEAQANVYVKQMLHLDQVVADYGDLVNYLNSIELDDGAPALAKH